MQFLNRPVGVRVPENQSTEQAPVMTVLQVAKIDWLLVAYGDERGIQHTTMVAIHGNKAYLPPQGEQWTAGFRSFTQALSEQIFDKSAVLSPPSTLNGSQAVPSADAVDVTGGG